MGGFDFHLTVVQPASKTTLVKSLFLQRTEFLSFAHFNIRTFQKVIDALSSDDDTKRVLTEQWEHASFIRILDLVNDYKEIDNEECSEPGGEPRNSEKLLSNVKWNTFPLRGDDGGDKEYTTCGLTTTPDHCARGARDEDDVRCCRKRGVRDAEAAEEELCVEEHNACPYCRTRRRDRCSIEHGVWHLSKSDICVKVYCRFVARDVSCHAQSRSKSKVRTGADK